MLTKHAQKMGFVGEAAFKSNVEQGQGLLSHELDRSVHAHTKNVLIRCAAGGCSKDPEKLGCAVSGLGGQRVSIVIPSGIGPDPVDYMSQYLGVRLRHRWFSQGIVESE
jgi:hypothetical protein